MNEEIEAVENEPSYYWSEGVAGEGDKPDWLNDKYKSVADQAKGYDELYKLHTKKPEVPENYAVNLPEGMPEDYSINTDDPLFEAAQAFAKESGMPQDKFDGLVQLYVENQIAGFKADNDYVAEEIAKLDNADQRIANITDFLKAQIPDSAEHLQETITTASGIKAMEDLIKKMTNKPLTAEGSMQSAVTQEEIERLMTEKDDNGKVIYRTSQARQELVRQKIAQMQGV